ncbi:hypothetical protein JCM6882_005859 [Rhodosporidiobolus microsporus]
MSDSSATATPAPTAPHDDPVLFRLPTELLLDVLSQLSYEELHQVERVCKKMQALVKDKHLDSLLFRQKPMRKLKKGEKVVLHPLMDLVNIVYTCSKDAPIRFYEDGVKDLNAFDYEACDEFVTQPACTLLYIDLRVGDLAVENSAGLTVREVLKSIGTFWGQKPDDTPYWMSDEEARHWTYSSTLGDRNGWSGWYRTSVTYDGAVSIAADGYDL